MLIGLLFVFLLAVSWCDAGQCCYQPGCTGCHGPTEWCSLSPENCKACAGQYCPGPGPTPSGNPSPAPVGCGWPACANGTGSFPTPTVIPNVRAKTKEQSFAETHWPGYLNGISLGGLFVIEDWMFWRNGGFDDATLHLQQNEQFSNHRWSEVLLQGNVTRAYNTMKCHVDHYVEDDDLDALAEFGVNAVRLPVGYWLFDDPELFPGDVWPHRPTSAGDYGVNPDGFITPGSLAVSNIVVKLYNRNMKVILDMHALPGCSSPRQSYAGIYCQDSSPNTWNGRPEDGISGGHTTTRARDGKTWTQFYQKLVMERVVPWIRFISRYAPNTVIGFEPVNEPDIMCSDASTDQVRCLTVEAAKAVSACLGNQVKVVMSNAANNYKTSTIAQDYLGTYSSLQTSMLTDLHHYYNWGGCIDWGSKQITMNCVCHTGLPGHDNQDGDWKAYQDAGLFDKGWRFFAGEWSSALGVAHGCNGGGPTSEQAAAMWLAQKWGYLSAHVAYNGKSQNGTSSFAGDFYWTARMGYNWNPDPAVCSGTTSTTDYQNFQFWDWSLIRLIKLGLVHPLSQLVSGGLTPQTLGALEAKACAGAFRVNC